MQLVRKVMIFMRIYADLCGFIVDIDAAFDGNKYIDDSSDGEEETDPLDHVLSKDTIQERTLVSISSIL